MNAITTSENRSVLPCAQSIGRHSAWGNLVRKECLDSREAAIAGVAIFWLVPALLGLIEFALEGYHGIFPFAWLAIIGAGWLYAVVVGAHTVCRDWGKPEEHFLLAQPVSPRTIVCAKLITGAALVAVVLGIAVGWNAILGQRDGFGPFGLSWTSMIVSATGAIAAGFAVAFAMAVMTRQMLASTIVATLALLVWATAPLLSSRLARFGVPALAPNGSGPATIVPFVLASFLIVAVSIVASLHCASRERVFRLGHKQLAWTAAGVMMALFGAAMTEVGNSLHVRDQAVTPSVGSTIWSIPRAAQNDRRFVTAYYDRLQRPREMGKWSLPTFRVSDGGRIRDLRTMPLPAALPSFYLGPQRPGHKRGDELIGLAFDKDGHIVVSGKRLRSVSVRQGIELETLWRTTLAWAEGGKPEVLSHAELAFPPNERLQAVAWDEDHLPRFSYVVSVAGDRAHYHEDKLYVFDWSYGPNPGPRYVIPLPQGTSVSVENGKVRVESAQGHFPDEHKFEADFDADHPETLLDKQNWSFHERRDRYEEPWTQEFERLGVECIRVDQHGDMAYLSDWLGLRVARRTHRGRWEIVGECRASPLSMLSRQYAEPKALDDALVIEGCTTGITVYDVSDPSNPKRIGYFNTIPFRVFSVGRYLVLLEYDLITVLDLPDHYGTHNR